jgi:glycosyltransferase involved in cell wall biosynthesis
VADIVDEIIIVDTGSSDATKEIAARYTDKIYDFEWIKDFSAARNYAFSFGTKEWLMWLDADDYLTQVDRENLKMLKKNIQEDADVILCRYNLNFDTLGNPVFYSTRERLVKNDGQPRWHGAVHEYMEVRGKAIMADFTVNHVPQHHCSIARNIDIYENMLQKGVVFSSREMYYYARELYYSNRHTESIKWMEKYLEQDDGWIGDKIQACLLLSKMYEGNASLTALFRSLTFDIPRSEICCIIGEKFLERKEYNLAVYWYKRAMDVQPPKLDFVETDSSEYIPAAQLCMCYWLMGDMEKAEEYNELAAEYKPYAQSVESNRRFFADKKRG